MGGAQPADPLPALLCAPPPPPAASPSARSVSGGPGTWVPPSHPHSHTLARARLRACLPRWFPSRRTAAHESLPSKPAGQPPSRNPLLRSALGQRPLLSTQLLCGLLQIPGPDPLAAAAAAVAAAGTWEQREALGHGTLTVPTEYWTYRSRIHKTLSP